MGWADHSGTGWDGRARRARCRGLFCWFSGGSDGIGSGPIRRPGQFEPLRTAGGVRRLHRLVPRPESTAGPPPNAGTDGTRRMVEDTGPPGGVMSHVGRWPRCAGCRPCPELARWTAAESRHPRAADTHSTRPVHP